MIIQNNKYQLFNKVVLASIHQWVSTHQKKNDGKVPDILLKLSTKGFNMKAVTGFENDEVKKLKAVETDPEFMGIKAKEISYLIHALVVLKLWIEDIPKRERPLLNISDDKMILGKAVYFKHMLLAKQVDPELYASEKLIIDETVEAAELWYKYFKKELVSSQTTS